MDIISSTLIVIVLLSVLLVLYRLVVPKTNFNYAAATTKPPPTNVPGDCRAVINAYRNWKSDKLQPLAAATAEQERCANKYAKIGGVDWKAKPKKPYTGVKCSEGDRLAFYHAFDKTANGMIAYYTIPNAYAATDLIYGTTYKSVACGSDGDGFNVAHFYK